MKMSEYSTVPGRQILHNTVYSCTVQCPKQEVTAQHTSSNVIPMQRKEDIRSGESKIIKSSKFQSFARKKARINTGRDIVYREVRYGINIPCGYKTIFCMIVRFSSHVIVSMRSLFFLALSRDTITEINIKNSLLKGTEGRRPIRTSRRPTVPH